MKALIFGLSMLLGVVAQKVQLIFFQETSNYLLLTLWLAYSLRILVYTGSTSALHYASL